MGKKSYRFCNLRNERISIKKQLTLLKMCVISLLCGPRADLWPFYGTRFIKGAKLFERMLIIDLFTVYDAVLAVGKHG